MKLSDHTISQVASLMGKKGWKARIKKYGLKKLQEHMREVGKKATGRPRLADNEVTPGALYQRERRARLRAEAKLEKGQKHGKNG